jgi:hypothetical protein
MGLDEIGNAFMSLIVVAIFAFVGVVILLALNGAFAPLTGSYSWEITAIGISGLIGAVVAAGYALKQAVSGG